MARPESNDLVISFQKKDKDYRKKEMESLKERISLSEVEEVFSKLKIQEYENELLRSGVKSAILGLIYGFKDRELDPFHKDHFSIFMEIIPEIESAFNSVNNENLDEEQWLFECFDYGIKHIYYLDWQLYLSKVCY